MEPFARFQSFKFNTLTQLIGWMMIFNYNLINGDSVNSTTSTTTFFFLSFFSLNISLCNTTSKHMRKFLACKYFQFRLIMYVFFLSSFKIYAFLYIFLVIMHPFCKYLKFLVVTLFRKALGAAKDSQF